MKNKKKKCFQRNKYGTITFVLSFRAKSLNFRETLARSRDILRKQIRLKLSSGIRYRKMYNSYDFSTSPGLFSKVSSPKGERRNSLFIVTSDKESRETLIRLGTYKECALQPDFLERYNGLPCNISMFLQIITSLTMVSDLGRELDWKIEIC